MRPTRANVMKRAAELGVSFEDRGISVVLDCPDGFTFGGIGIHYQTIFTDGWTRPQVWAELLHTMSEPLEACTATDCDVCQ